jgi:2-desacetyl-2-hydroxyethyl bacteriochlorophyllide A dehydrogenase
MTSTDADPRREGGSAAANTHHGGGAATASEWLLEAPERLNRRDTTLPRPVAGEIVVATRCGAISPGTERALLHGVAPSVPASRYPHQPGRLNIVTITDAADRTLIGERGVATLGHRDLALIPYSRFCRIPTWAPDELGILAVLAADAQHAIETAAVASDEDCVVIGGGIVGVLTAWELGFRTRGDIRLLERDERRRELLGEISWPQRVTVVAEASTNRFHNVFECAGNAAAFHLALRLARPNGSIVVLSVGSHEKYVLADEFFAKELYLGKASSHPDLRGFLNDYFTRGEDRASLLEVAFRSEIRFADFPGAYLQALLAPPEEREGLLPRIVYPISP